jgi:hypothetical protein
MAGSNVFEAADSDRDINMRLKSMRDGQKNIATILAQRNFKTCRSTVADPDQTVYFPDTASKQKRVDTSCEFLFQSDEEKNPHTLTFRFIHSE